LRYQGPVSVRRRVMADLPRPIKCVRACRREHAPALLLALLIGARGAAAEGTGTNVVTASADAFGIAIGVEALGVYNPGEVRGFDPIAAGNARIEGLYVDVQGPTVPYGPLPARLVQDTHIHVGLAAAGFPFPSPTGIVDFSLRSPLGRPGLSSTVYVGPYGTSGFDLDAHAPLANERCGVGGGVTRRWDEFVPDGTQFTTDVAVIGSCRTAAGSGGTVFYGRTTETQQAVWPWVYVTTTPTPQPVEARNTGPIWAHGTVVLTDYGGLFKLEAPDHWTLRAGVFRSIYDQPNSGQDLLYNPNPAGIATQQFVAYPDQQTASTSGELRITHLTEDGPRQHEVILTVRARDVTASYGGYDEVDLGSLQLGTQTAVPAPVFTFGPTTSDHIEQWTAGAAYALHWRAGVDLAVGLEQVRYDRTVLEPAAAPISQHETPFLYYATAAVPVITHLSAYAALTRGLEDSGVAPASATNRGQLLPVSRTSQEEVGVRYTAGKTTLVAGIFEVEKPYYNIGSDGSYTWLGTERHPGLELSLNAEPLSGLTVVAGGVFMAPVVTLGSGVQGVGTAPVAQTRRILQLAADYRLAIWPRCSLDITATQFGSVPVRVDDGAYIPTQTLVNVGTRYRFSVSGHEATLRVAVQNVSNLRSWSVIDLSGGLVAYPPQHMVFGYLSADF
jgi:iron complex outermembrane receptor protein